MIARLFRRSRDEHIIAQLYGRIVDHARSTPFYTQTGVPDTIDGRYELLVIHAFLLMHRMKHEGEAAKVFSQRFFDFMFADMDYNLRELGVGDLSIGKKVKHMARRFYGSVVAYDHALTDGGDETLEEALLRNLYGGAPPRREQSAAMADYIKRQAAGLATIPIARLMKGDVSFGLPVGPPGDAEADGDGTTPGPEAAVAQEKGNG